MDKLRDVEMNAWMDEGLDRWNDQFLVRCDAMNNRTQQWPHLRSALLTTIYDVMISHHAILYYDMIYILSGTSDCSLTRSRCNRT